MNTVKSIPEIEFQLRIDRLKQINNQFLEKDFSPKAKSHRILPQNFYALNPALKTLASS